MSSVFFSRPQNPPPNLRQGKFPVSSFSAGSAPHPHLLTGYLACKFPLAPHPEIRYHDPISAAPPLLLPDECAFSAAIFFSEATSGIFRLCGTFVPIMLGFSTESSTNSGCSTNGGNCVCTFRTPVLYFTNTHLRIAFCAMYPATVLIATSGKTGFSPISVQRPVSPAPTLPPSWAFRRMWTLRLSGYNSQVR